MGNMISPIPTPVPIPYVTRRTYAFGEKVEARRQTHVITDPITNVVRRPNLLVKLAETGPMATEAANMIDPTSEIITVPW